MISKIYSILANMTNEFIHFELNCDQIDVTMLAELEGNGVYVIKMQTWHFSSRLRSIVNKNSCSNGRKKILFFIFISNKLKAKKLSSINNIFDCFFMALLWNTDNNIYSYWTAFQCWFLWSFYTNKKPFIHSVSLFIENSCVD